MVTGQVALEANAISLLDRAGVATHCCRAFAALRYCLLGRHGESVALLLLGPALALGWVNRQPLPQCGATLTSPRYIALAARLMPVRTAHVATDRGRPVPLYHVADANAFPARLQEDEGRDLREFPLQLIRTGPPDENTNCAGWLFTGGAYWVYPEDVPAILEDNGYQPLPVPLPDDLAIYYDPAGHVMHCGLVRAAPPGGPVLVESKWGITGRYVHRVEDSPYGGHCTYYHTNREHPTRHLLDEAAAHDHISE